MGDRKIKLIIVIIMQLQMSQVVWEKSVREIIKCGGKIYQDITQHTDTNRHWYYMKINYEEDFPRQVGLFSSEDCILKVLDKAKNSL